MADAVGMGSIAGIVNQTDIPRLSELFTAKFGLGITQVNITRELLL